MTTPLPDSPATRARWALLTAALALAVYLPCLPPTITGEDAGELVVAAHTLGVPHPPGYPTWTLLAHAFTWLPWGSVAWRVALFSAVCAAAAAGLLASLAMRLGAGRLAGLAAGLALAYSRELWEQAMIPEVYTLNLLCLVLLLHLFDQYRRAAQEQRRHLLPGIGLLCGLGLGVHPTLWVLAPLLALALLALDRTVLTPRRSLPALAACALGAMVYLYLPWASSRNPPVDWGNPETLHAFWDHITRQQFAFMPGENPRGLARYLRQIATLLGMAPAQFTPWIGALALPGLLWMGRRHAPTTLLAIAAGLATTLAFAWAQNFPHDAEWRWVMSVFQLPLYLALALGIAGAVAWTAGKSRALAAGLALLVVASPLAANRSHNYRAQDIWVEAHARALLDPLPEGAILVPTADHETFPVLYLQSILGHRTDVALGRKYGYLEMDLWSDMPDAARFGRAPARRHEAELLDWLVRHDARPVYVGLPPVGAARHATRYVREGLLFRAWPPGAEPAPVAPPKDAQPLPPPDTGDFTGRFILLRRELAWADARLDAGDEPLALGHLRRAATYFPADPRMANHLGIWCARNGFAGDAAHLFRSGLATALASAPDDQAVQALQANLQRLEKR